MLINITSCYCLLLLIIMSSSFTAALPTTATAIDEQDEVFHDTHEEGPAEHVVFDHPPPPPPPPSHIANKRYSRRPLPFDRPMIDPERHAPLPPTTTPHSATFSTAGSIGRRSVLTTPGLAPSRVHTERFEGQFIQPRFSNPILKDLTMALSEFQGTLVFLLIAFIGSNPTASVNEVALVYAMGLLSTIVMHSSSQENPSISVIQAALGKLSPRQAAMNIVAQITASISASGIQTLACSDTWSVAELSVSPARGLLVETVLSTVLFTSVLWVSALPAVQKRTMPFLIALIFLGLEVAGIRLTSASLNSARQLGPAIVSGRWHSYDWIYHLGPAIAAPLSLLIFKSNQLLQSPDAEPSDVGPGQLVDTFRLQRRRQMQSGGNGVVEEEVV